MERIRNKIYYEIDENGRLFGKKEKIIDENRRLFEKKKK